MTHWNHRPLFVPDCDRLPATHAWAAADSDPPAAYPLREVMARVLTAKQREAVEGFFFEGFSQQALADRFGVTQQVVHKRIFGTRRNGKLVGGALGRLRKALDPDGDARGGDDD